MTTVEHFICNLSTVVWASDPKDIQNIMSLHETPLHNNMFSKSYHLCWRWRWGGWSSSDPPAAAASASGRTGSPCRAGTPFLSPSSFLWKCWPPPALAPLDSSWRWRLGPSLWAGPRCCSDLRRETRWMDSNETGHYEEKSLDQMLVCVERL